MEGVAPSLFLDGRVSLYGGDCLAVLGTLAENSVDSCVTDPPYHLTSVVKRFGAPGAKPARSSGKTGVYARSARGFMGQTWDGGDAAFRPELWVEVLRVLKPGAHLFAFGGTRTYHRLVCAIEEAGFEIRDQFVWAYGSGFPKSHDVAKGIDRHRGAKGTYGEPKSAAHAGWIDRGAMRGGDGHEGYQRPWMDDAEAVSNAARQYIAADADAREWDGWGTAAKPAIEPICLARKPLSEATVAANVLRWGTGALNIAECRIEATDGVPCFRNAGGPSSGVFGAGLRRNRTGEMSVVGRWPANLVHDGSDEVLEAFPQTAQAAAARLVRPPAHGSVANGANKDRVFEKPADAGGSAARFFYSAKADADDRLGSSHPTVKPVDLMQWLVRLVTPPRGLVLDGFAGTGTTGEAAWREGFSAVLIEREAVYQADIARRMALCLAGPDERAREAIKVKTRARNGGLDLPPGPLFAEVGRGG